MGARGRAVGRAHGVGVVGEREQRGRPHQFHTPWLCLVAGSVSTRLVKDYLVKDLSSTNRPGVCVRARAGWHTHTHTQTHAYTHTQHTHTHSKEHHALAHSIQHGATSQAPGLCTFASWCWRGPECGCRRVCATLSPSCVCCANRDDCARWRPQYIHTGIAVCARACFPAFVAHSVRTGAAMCRRKTAPTRVPGAMQARKRAPAPNTAQH